MNTDRCRVRWHSLTPPESISPYNAWLPPDTKPLRTAPVTQQCSRLRGGSGQTQTASSLLGIRRQEFDPSGAECIVRAHMAHVACMYTRRNMQCGAARCSAEHILDVDSSRQTINKARETTHVLGDKHTLWHPHWREHLVVTLLTQPLRCGLAPCY